MPDTALRDSAVPQSLERLCAGGELHYDIGSGAAGAGNATGCGGPFGPSRSRSVLLQVLAGIGHRAMERPVSAPCFPVTSVRMKTIRSPFFPEILAQTPGWRW
ncbi:hypothetical protein SCALM49S_08319 [Streptomyces californicus]